MTKATTIFNIVGARPQFVKYSAVAKAIEAFNRRSKCVAIRDVLVHTGQHYDYMMSKVFFDEFGMKRPDHHLEVGSGSHGVQTSLVMTKIEQLLEKKMPAAVVVYGDTNSTLGGALAAAKQHVPVLHVEAGLRSFNKRMPEEINRVLTDHASSLLLCPTGTAVSNLKKEGFQNIVNSGRLCGRLNIPKRIKPCDVINDPFVINVGDVMYDVVLDSVKLAEQRSTVLGNLGIDKKSYYLLTLHRAENTDDPEALKRVIQFVNAAAAGRTVIFPVHPRTAKVYKVSKTRFDRNVRLIEPLGYFDMLKALKNAAMLMTDSGGMQKEAFWLEVPCITLREETEWTETVASGWNILYRNYRKKHSPGKKKRDFYGDGKASEKIVTCIKAFIG